MRYCLSLFYDKESWHDTDDDGNDYEYGYDMALTAFLTLESGLSYNVLISGTTDDIDEFQFDINMDERYMHQDKLVMLEDMVENIHGGNYQYDAHRIYGEL